MVRALKGGERTGLLRSRLRRTFASTTPTQRLFGAKELLEKNNYKTQTLKMLEKPEIPKDCTIVIVAGPKHDYIQPEVDALKKYVEDGGHALFMLDPPLKFAKEEIDDNAALAAVLARLGRDARIRTWCSIPAASARFSGSVRNFRW